jgi:hypothetical protein
MLYVVSIWIELDTDELSNKVITISDIVGSVCEVTILMSARSQADLIGSLYQNSIS